MLGVKNRWTLGQGRMRHLNIDACEDALARSMRAHFTPSVLELIQSDEWKGSDLIVLSSSVARPTSSELARNWMFLKPIVMDSPSKAGST